jgi:hypothetical protein
MYRLTPRAMILFPVLTGLAIAITLAAVGETPAHPLPESRLTRGSVLYSNEVSKILPGSLFFRGEQTPVEPRNSSGLQFADGMYLLTAIIDTSGHTGSEDEEFQACFITEVPLDINRHKLGPGVYEVSMDDNHHFVVMDISSHPVFIADSRRDLKLSHPIPLQIVDDSPAHDYRLYLGRDYVTLSRTIRKKD